MFSDLNRLEIGFVWIIHKRAQFVLIYIVLACGLIIWKYSSGSDDFSQEVVLAVRIEEFLERFVSMHSTEA